LEILLEERIESLKAGVLAGLAFCLAYGLAVWANSHPFELLIPLQAIAGIEGWLRWGSAWASGFLFGVTYRYIVRNDANSHLKAGAVLAFAIARAVAPVGLERFSAARMEVWAIFGVESLFCYASASVALDWALQRGWVQPIKK
jgi:hypothetical protein